ncbi:hypothetical protein DH86_00003805, partial [Scytalidium sp. 3C]
MHHNSINRLQQEDDIFGTPEVDQKSNGHLPTKIVIDPPNLAEWRQRLFNVDETITLTQEEFETYFPHVDNVYSHRSTQRYKRKPFVSHYWDCRLKGRPPGTPKSDDPNKKKRKRVARERDLCDVKIKITEYFPGAMLRADFAPDGPHGQPDPVQDGNFFSRSGAGQTPHNQQGFGISMVNPAIPPGHPGASGQRYYTIQRVNGNGGNGKGDGVAGPHKHGLEESDKVKKNSVQRYLMKREKEEKKTQRVWIALEAKGIQYQYIEVDPYKKTQALLEVNPRGLVPALRHGDWLEEIGSRPHLPQNDPRLRATCRYWGDH